MKFIDHMHETWNEVLISQQNLTNSPFATVKRTMRFILYLMIKTNQNQTLCNNDDICFKT